jgi:predicted GNAT superfamily acetyltransferase
VEKKNLAFPDPAALGFRGNGNEEAGWTRSVRGQDVQFRVLRTLTELGQAERLQVDVFGVTERDLIPANELIVIPDTGGAVIATFLPAQPERAIGVVIGWGGFVGRPRIVSDFLAVRPEARNLGLAAEMKRLQAAIALSRGFAEIIWTVDPLRVANARLNFGKLGAISRNYEIDRYGSSYAEGLYGGLPTDRLHVLWEITTPRVIAHLLGNPPPQPAFESGDIAPYSPGATARFASLAIPADIDAVLATAPDEALAWRLAARDGLIQAFDEGFAVTGFLPTSQGGHPALLLERSTAGR